MPRRVFDALAEATAQCTDGDIAKSNFVFEYARLNSFYLVPAYPSCLFIGNKIVLPHDVVFTVLFHLHTFSLLRHVHFKDLALEICSHITLDIVQYFLRVVKKASPLYIATQNGGLVVSSSGINGFGTPHIQSTTKSPTAGNMVPISHPRQQSTPTSESTQPKLTQTLSGSHIKTSPLNHDETDLVAPSSPLSSKISPITTHFSSPLSVNNSSPSPRSPSSSSLTKRLFETEITARETKKARILQDTPNQDQPTPSEGQVVESSKKANKLWRRATRSFGKTQERIVSPIGRNAVVGDSSGGDPQTSPITKTIPGSFLSHGEHLEGIWRKRLVREKENEDVEKGSWW